MIAGMFIAALSAWFFYELNLVREPPTGTKASAPPILGLNDEATKRSEEDLGRNRPLVQACSAAKPGAAPCAAGQRDFCDADGQHLACCAVGMVALPGKAAQVACACAPGGASAPAGESASCTQAASYEGVAKRGIEAKLDRLRLCRASALKRSESAPTKLDIKLRVAPDGAVFQSEVPTESADAAFKECVVSWVETVKLAPPPDGDHSASFTIDLTAP